MQFFNPNEHPLFLDLKRTRYERDIFEGNSPLGVLVHVTPGNAPGLSFLAMIEGLLTHNLNIMRLSSKDSDLTLKLVEELLKYDPNINSTEIVTGFVVQFHFIT